MTSSTTPGTTGAEEWSEILDPLARLGETWWLGLRMTQGVDPRAARAAAGYGGAGRPDPAEQKARQLAARDLLELRDRRWRLTERGLPVADRIGTEFLDLTSMATAKLQESAG